MSKLRRDMQGKRIGKLTVGTCTGEKKRNSFLWNVKCDCGANIVLGLPQLSRNMSCGSCYKQIDEKIGVAKFMQPKRPLRFCNRCHEKLPPERYFNHVQCVSHDQEHLGYLSESHQLHVGK